MAITDDDSAPDATRPSLLLRLRDPSDGDAWRVFVDTYTPLVYAYCRRRGLQASDVADVTQEVMAQVMRSIANFSYQAERGRFRDWLGAVTRGKLLRFLSKDARAGKAGDESSAELVLQVEDPDSDTLWTEAFQARVLEVAMQRSRPDFEETTWKLFERSWVRGEAAATIATELSVPVEWVYVAKIARIEAAAHRGGEPCRGLSAFTFIARLRSPAREPVIDVDACPSDEQLNLFLSGNDDRELALHVRECTRCQESLERLSDDGSLRPTVPQSGGSEWDWGNPDELSSILEALRNQRGSDRGGGQPKNGTDGPILRDLAQTIAAIGTLAPMRLNQRSAAGGWVPSLVRRDRTTGRRVAVKVLFGGSDDERTRRRFVQEVARPRRSSMITSYVCTPPAIRRIGFPIS